MKILFINNYKEQSGWSQSGRDYILAMDAVGINVVPRHINMGMPQHPNIPPRILELEKKSDKNCDVVIQYVLPEFLDYCGYIPRNIAMYMVETEHFRHTNWTEKINNMDEAWVASYASVTASVKSGVKIPIYRIEQPCDVSKFSSYYKPLQFSELKNQFIFYTIGEMTRRKNLVALLEAFHLEFDPDEPVGLMIKGSVPGLSNIAANKNLVQVTQTVKKQLNKFNKLSSYKGEIILTQSLTDEQIMGLHAGCNCFVMPSYGEGWCYPAFDAMAMGKTPICTNHTSMTDYIFKDNGDLCGWLVDSIKQPVSGMVDFPHNHLYNANTNWYKIDTLKLRKAMRKAYENKTVRTQRADHGIDNAFNFSYEKVGQKIKSILENPTTQELNSG